MSAEMPEQMQCEDIDAADGDRCEEEATHHCSKCGRMCQVTSVFPRDLQRFPPRPIKEDLRFQFALSHPVVHRVAPITRLLRRHCMYVVALAL